MTFGVRDPWVLGSATLLLTGKVLLAEGNGAYGLPESAFAEVDEPSTQAFSQVGNMTAVRAEHAATLLPDGTALIAGSWATMELVSL